MRLMNRLFCIAILFFSPSLLSAPAQPSTKSVIVDVDMDFDDILVLGFLSNLPSVDIKLITINTVGWVHCQQGLANVAKTFQLVNKATPKTVCGRNTTLSGGHSGDVPAVWRQHADNFFGIKALEPILPAHLLTHAEMHRNITKRPLSAAASATDNAVSQILEILRQADSPVEIITLSTLTNISDLTDALAGQSELIKKISGIYMMGGAFSPAEGNVQPNIKDNTVAEWNMYIDPKAAQNVLSNPHNLNLVQVPLNITNMTPITRSFPAKLKALESPSDAVKLAIELFELNDWLLTEKIFYFWDSLTAMLALWPEKAMYWDNQSVVVETEENNCTGQTFRRTGGVNKIAYKLNIHESVSFDDLLVNLLQGDIAASFQK